MGKIEFDLTPVSEDLLNSKMIPLKEEDCQIVHTNVVPTERSNISSFDNMELNYHSLTPESQDLYDLIDDFGESLYPLDYNQFFSSPLPNNFFDQLDNMSQSISSLLNETVHSCLEGPNVLQITSSLKKEECPEVRADDLPSEFDNILSDGKLESKYCFPPTNEEGFSDMKGFIDNPLALQSTSYIGDTPLPGDNKVWADYKKLVVFKAEKCDEDVKSSIVPSREYNETVPSEMIDNSNHFCIMFKQGPSLCVCGEGKYPLIEPQFIPFECVDSLKHQTIKENTDINSPRKVQLSDEILSVSSQKNVRLPRKPVGIKGIISSKVLPDTESTKFGTVSQNPCFALNNTKIGNEQSEANFPLRAVVYRRAKTENIASKIQLGKHRFSEKVTVSIQSERPLKQITELNLPNAIHPVNKPCQLPVIPNIKSGTFPLDNCLTNVEKQRGKTRKVVMLKVVPIPVEKEDVSIKQENEVRSQSSMVSTKANKNIMIKATMVKKFSRRKTPTLDTISNVAEVENESPSLYSVDKQKILPNHYLSLGNVKIQDQQTRARNESEQKKIRKDSNIAEPTGCARTLRVPCHAEFDRPMNKRNGKNIITVAGSQKRLKVLCSWNSPVIPKEFLKTSDCSKPQQRLNSLGNLQKIERFSEIGKRKYLDDAFATHANPKKRRTAT